MTEDISRAAVLASDGWRPLSEYAGREYVYVRGFGFDLWKPGTGIARRGRHPLSDWWDPAGQLLRLDVKEWQPFPEGGATPHERWLAFSTKSDDTIGFVRPPEAVYAPGDTSVRLTPTPLRLLTAMRDGAVLHERAWRWTEWSLGRPGTTPDKIGERPINPLLKVAFIARDGVLPPGRLPHWFEFDWLITPAGHAWLTANAKPAASAAQHKQTT
jgi:hypothetical protein